MIDRYPRNQNPNNALLYVGVPVLALGFGLGAWWLIKRSDAKLDAELAAAKAAAEAKREAAKAALEQARKAQEAADAAAAAGAADAAAKAAAAAAAVDAANEAGAAAAVAEQAAESKAPSGGGSSQPASGQQPAYGSEASLTLDQRKSIQRALNLLGYANPALLEDGAFGPKTRAAVKAFQTAKTLTVDGKVGPQTQKAIADALVAKGSSAVSEFFGQWF